MSRKRSRSRRWWPKSTHGEVLMSSSTMPVSCTQRCVYESTPRYSASWLGVRMMMRLTPPRQSGILRTTLTWKEPGSAASMQCSRSADMAKRRRRWSTRLQLWRLSVLQLHSSPTPPPRVLCWLLLASWPSSTHARASGSIISAPLLSTPPCYRIGSVTMSKSVIAARSTFRVVGLARPLSRLIWLFSWLPMMPALLLDKRWLWTVEWLR